MHPMHHAGVLQPVRGRAADAWWTARLPALQRPHHQLGGGGASGRRPTYVEAAAAAHGCGAGAAAQGQRPAAAAIGAGAASR